MVLGMEHAAEFCRLPMLRWRLPQESLIVLEFFISWRDVNRYRVIRFFTQHMRWSRCPCAGYLAQGTPCVLVGDIVQPKSRYLHSPCLHLFLTLTHGSAKLFFLSCHMKFVSEVAGSHQQTRATERLERCHCFILFSAWFIAIHVSRGQEEQEDQEKSADPWPIGTALPWDSMHLALINDQFAHAIFVVYQLHCMFRSS